MASKLENQENLCATHLRKWYCKANIVLYWKCSNYFPRFFKLGTKLLVSVSRFYWVVSSMCRQVGMVVSTLHYGIFDSWWSKLFFHFNLHYLSNFLTGCDWMTQYLHLLNPVSNFNWLKWILDFFYRITLHMMLLSTQNPRVQCPHWRRVPGVWRRAVIATSQIRG